MWKFIREQPIATIGMVIGGFISVGSRVNDAYALVNAGLPAAIWEAIGAAIFFAAVILLLFRWQRSPIAQKTQIANDTPAAIPTRLKLQFNVGSDIPTALETVNIWRWYALTHIIVGKDKKGKMQELRVLTIFIVFDKPVAFKQILLNSGGAILPRPEIKDSSSRHAVVVLSDAIPGVVLEITAVT